MLLPEASAGRDRRQGQRSFGPTDDYILKASLIAKDFDFRDAPL